MFEGIRNLFFRRSKKREEEAKRVELEKLRKDVLNEIALFRGRIECDKRIKEIFKSKFKIRKGDVTLQVFREFVLAVRSFFSKEQINQIDLYLHDDKVAKGSDWEKLKQAPKIESAFQAIVTILRHQGEFKEAEESIAYNDHCEERLMGEIEQRLNELEAAFDEKKYEDLLDELAQMQKTLRWQEEAYLTIHHHEEIEEEVIRKAAAVIRKYAERIKEKRGYWADKGKNLYEKAMEIEEDLHFWLDDARYLQILTARAYTQGKKMKLISEKALEEAKKLEEKLEAS